MGRSMICSDDFSVEYESTNEFAEEIDEVCIESGKCFFTNGTSDDSIWSEINLQQQLHKKKKNQVLLEGYVESADEYDLSRTKSLTDDDLEELKGCLDLGFGFSYEEIPELCNTLPALELCYFGIIEKSKTHLWFTKAFHGLTEVLKVFLLGSFNGWTNRIRMISVEGSSSIFMIICDVPPGYHQYKFLVNGVWRIDDQQRCVQDENGAINNLMHVDISESTGIYDPNMMLDNTASTQISTPLPSVTKELQLLDTDKDVFQRNIFMHLSSQKIFHLMPESGKVFALDDEVAIKDAFHIMHEQGLHSVPIMDGNRRQISGMLTASDFILILIEVVLYQDIRLCNEPTISTPKLLGWYPLYFPLTEPVYVASGVPLELDFWRCCDLTKMEKSDAYKNGSTSGKKWDGGGPGGPGSALYGGGPRGPPRGIDNVRGIDHSSLPACGSYCG